jgi:2-methoxy-6-polyprenyl-1,4-benzoquinol methylase
MGQVLASQWEPYQYLVESIRKFPKQPDFKKMIRSAGFRAVDYENLTFGVCAIHSGYKI